jgi:SAM-dependent methyltransferase
MSKFSQKIFNNETPTQEDWIEHLIEAHDLAPSMTPNAFAAYKSKDGRNSYEILSGEIKSFQDLRILDLGCGDGFLTNEVLPKLSATCQVIGIDMSETELGVARGQQQDPRVSFVLGRAQGLPLTNAWADYILCHMVFMLMVPLDPVVAEIRRVLKPGAVFAAVIGNTKNAVPTIWNDILNSVYGPIFQRYPKIKEAVMGDARVNSAEGLQALFGDGFTPPKFFDFSIVVEMKPDNAWSLLKDMYFVGMLPDPEKQKVEKDVRQLVIKLSATHKTFEFPMRMFSVTKNS